MFVTDGVEAAKHILSAGDWVFFGCVSFEERWRAFADRIAPVLAPPRHATLLFPLDTGSIWATACEQKQSDELARFQQGVGWAHNVVTFSLPESPSWAVAEDALEDLVARNPATGVVLDISAMPKSCFFPLVARLLRDGSFQHIIVVYSEPGTYNAGVLESEPIGPPYAIPPFDHLPVERGAEIAWIPSLGFVADFSTIVYDSLREAYSLESRIFPLMGFPAFNPALFERATLTGARSMLQALRTRVSLRDQFVFAGAADPFDTMSTVLALMADEPNVHWIATPFGPKPMALGLALAAIDCEAAGRPMSIVTCQARSYHPQYSESYGESRGYILRLNGMRNY